MIILSLTSCGGGGGGGGDSSTTDTNPQSSSSSVTIESIPSSRIAPAWDITSNDQLLYLSTHYGLLEVNKTTGRKRALTGNTLIAPDGAEMGSVEFTHDLRQMGGYLYAAGRSVFRVNTDVDNKTAVEIALPQHQVQGCCNFDGITGNETTLFYYQSNGTQSSDIFSLEHDSTAPSSYVTTVPGTIEALATKTSLFVSNAETTDNSVYKYDLTSGQRTKIQSTSNTYRPAAMATNETDIFWFNDDALYKADLQSNVPILVTTGITNVVQIIADTQYVYALQSGLYPVGTQVYRINVATGLAEQMATGIGIRGIALHNNTVYAAASGFGFKLYSLSVNNAPVELFTSIGTEFTASGNDPGLTATSDRLLFSNGEKLLVYEVSSGNYEIVYPRTRPSYFFVENNVYYFAHRLGDPGISRMSLSGSLRTAESLYPASISGNNEVLSSVIDQGYFYSILRSFLGSGQPFVYRLSKTSLDGVTNELLFESADELQDVAIHNGEIFFSCLSSCGDPGWVLASMGLTGGTPRPVFGLLNAPKIHYENGLFYIADTDDSVDQSLFVIDVDRNEFIELVTGLYIGEVYIDVSSEWLYVSENMAVAYAPRRRLTRYPLAAWNRVNTGEVIVDGGADEVVYFRPQTIHTDDNYLFYWHDGLKRVKE